MFLYVTLNILIPIAMVRAGQTGADLNGSSSWRVAGLGRFQLSAGPSSVPCLPLASAAGHHDRASLMASELGHPLDNEAAPGAWDCFLLHPYRLRAPVTWDLRGVAHILVRRLGRPGPAQPSSARPSSARPSSARAGPARSGPVWARSVSGTGGR